jgi:hypothetical protein
LRWSGMAGESNADERGYKPAFIRVHLRPGSLLRLDYVRARVDMTAASPHWGDGRR